MQLWLVAVIVIVALGLLAARVWQSYRHGISCACRSDSKACPGCRCEVVERYDEETSRSLHRD